MSGFTYKDVYVENGRRVLEVNVLPDKYCNFDCIFCPIGKSHQKADMPMSFDNIDVSLAELDRMLDAAGPDMVFINSKGESFVNEGLEPVIGRIKARGLPVKLLSNGYVLGWDAYMGLANRCDEVIGEIKVATEADFQKIQRPMEGYSLEEHISNMAAFNRQYPGKFILEVTLIKGYTDSDEAVEFLKGVIERIEPDEVLVERITEDKFQNKLGVSDTRFVEISKVLKGQ